MNKSGIFEFNRLTNMPATITPPFTIISFDVKIILACKCASLLLVFCNRYKERIFAINANIETMFERILDKLDEAKDKDKGKPRLRLVRGNSF